jgi:hypothetical protein
LRKTNLVFILMLLVNLSGCMGITFSRNGHVVVNTDYSPVENFKDRESPPARKSDKVNPDGSETFRVYDGTKWCGLTIWAILPIPLWLPVCDAYTEVTYKDGKPVNVATQWLHTSGLLCGPLILVPTGMDGGSSSLCTTRINHHPNRED